MPNLADLPNELFTIVLDMALHGESDVQRLCGLSILSRRWYAAVVNRIYSEWTFNGARQSFRTLWNFLRTMRHNSELAALVRTVNIGNWGFFDHAYTPGRDIQLPPDEVAWIRRAIHDAGIGHLESDILGSLQKRDRRPLMALLLTSLPNLLTLYAHVPQFDPVLLATLEQIMIRQDNGNPSSALRHLRELYLLQEVSVFPHLPHQDSDDDSDDSDEARREAEFEIRRRSGSLHFNDLWPILLLQSLRTLHLYDVNPDEVSALLGSFAGASPVENLDLAIHSNFSCRASDIQTLIGLPDTLKRLSFFLRDEVWWESDVPMVTKPEVWKGLLAHRQSLEMIDFYCYGFMSKRRDRFGLLRDFLSLKHVSLQVETLLGGCDDELPQVPLLPKDTLPPTLESLTIYGNAEFDIITELPMQLQELVSSDFPCLRCIVLEEAQSLYDNETGEIKVPYQSLERKCKENGVEFRIQKGDQLLRGGIRPELWEKTLYMQDDGNERAEWFGLKPEKFRDLQELLLRPADAPEEDDGDLNSDGEWGPHRGKRGIPRRAKVHVVPFSDHCGQAACMVFPNLVDFPLPPLFSFAIYFTRTQASPEHVDMEGLYQQLTSGFDIYVRFDLYFLPGASTNDCMWHYGDEKRVRGTYKKQIQMFEESENREEARPLPGTTGQIPGMVYKYRGQSPYRGLLYICRERDWRDGQLTMERVCFDPRPTAREIQQVQIVTCPLSDESPVADDDDVGRLVSQDMYEMAHWKRDDVEGPWQQATSWGWSTW